jgi:hypothetical protein
MSLPAGPVPTRQTLLTQLRGFLLTILPTGWQVIVTQMNRVPAPSDNFVAITQATLRRIATTVDTWSNAPAPPPTLLDHQQSVEAKVQLQVFSVNAADAVNIITTLLRSDFAYQFFAPGLIAPLTCDDGLQVPFITGEDQYEHRWIIEATLSMSVGLSTQQQFADTLTFDLALPVDLEPVA